MKAIFRLLRDSRGFSLLQVMIVAGVMLAVSIGILTYHNMALKSSAESNIYYQVGNVQHNIIAILNGSPGWNRTYLRAGAPNATAFACLRTTPANCFAQTGVAQGNFAVYDGSDVLYYDSSVASNGFDLNGLPCTGFTAAGNDRCPFHLDLNWTPNCNGANPCPSPQITITGTFTFSPTVGSKLTNHPFNQKAYAISFIRGSANSSIGNGTANYLVKWNTITAAVASLSALDSGGNIGISTGSPAEALDVTGNIKSTGQMYSGLYSIGSGATVDFNNGAMQVLSSVGGAAITLNNMKDGGSYILIIRDTTSRTYTFTNCTNSVFFPANAATTNAKTTLYNILKTSISGATYCYISWRSGF